MRIIAGEFRGRKLISPESDTTRPITDRVKQSLFDVLTPLIPDAIVYDCFAGTGSMGLECLSRGAGRTVFFERDRAALARLKQNIDALCVTDRAKVIAGDLFQWFESPANDDPATLLFLDPPYRFVIEQADRLRALSARIAQAHLSSGGVVVFRHDAADRLDLPGLARYDQREYGNMSIELLRRADD